MAKVQGTCEPRFAKVKDLFQSYLDAGEELGASVCVNVDGKDVVDIWGGHADEARTCSWEEDTVTCIWSSTKTVCALAALVCIDRGLLDPYEKVSRYWPEFAANGKEGVEVRHFLSHASGLSGWEESITIEDMCNIEKSTKLLEQQAPWWEPGTATGYHGWTMGHLVGELVRRVTGKPIKEFIAEELARPLAADFQLGIPEKEWNRVADIIPPPMPAKQEMQAFALDPNNLMFRSLGKNPGMDANWANQSLLRNSAIAAGNGYSNARGLVRLLSVISLENRSFLSAKTIDRIFSTQQEHKDLVIPVKVRFGLGFGLPAEGSMMANLPQGRVTSWGGWGGSQVVADADRKLTIGYVMNKMEAAGLGQQEGGKGGMGNTRTKAFIAAVYEAFGVEP